ncbi:MAG: adenylate cyclase [Candidatus Marinimicrobia bacterium]|nr:adenylate cyclase [Candidatus Neomarinimicrobiota bacterium]
MHLEIERRFLVNKEKFIFPNNKKLIKQAYLMVDDSQVLRIRKVENDYLLTYKYKKTNINRLEFEYPIDSDDGNKLISLSKYFIIEKDRYYYQTDNHLWEIDVFHSDNNGLIIAEIELKDENEDFEIPDWIDKEISNDDRYLNFNLSIKPYRLW